MEREKGGVSPDNTRGPFARTYLISMCLRLCSELPVYPLAIYSSREIPSRLYHSIFSRHSDASVIRASKYITSLCSRRPDSPEILDKSRSSSHVGTNHL